MKVVTICGSMRYAADMQRIARELTCNNGWCVLQCVYDTSLPVDASEKSKLKDAHLKRIDISDAIYVVNISGYIGSSTKDEISYALAHNKEVIYHEKIN